MWATPGCLTAPLSRNRVNFDEPGEKKAAFATATFGCGGADRHDRLTGRGGGDDRAGGPVPDPSCDVHLGCRCDSTDSDGGTSYVVPGTGTITSWSHQARAGSGQMFSFKVFRKVADPATYMVVGHDGPRSLTGGALNTFAGISIPVKPGDLIGINSGSGTMTACVFDVLGETYWYTSPGSLTVNRSPSSRAPTLALTSRPCSRPRTHSASARPS